MPFSSGHLAAIISFALWGLFPIYWKFFPEVGAWDLFAHRLVWSFITLIVILLIKSQLSSLKRIWLEPKVRLMLIASAILISSNWLLYIYAVSIGKILEASMGYFLNPLINVFMGWIILKEKIRPGQWPAIILALIAILLIGFQSIDQFPWIALTLSLTFAMYGLIRKLAKVGSLEGLAFETCVMIIPVFIIWYFQPSHPLDIFSQLAGWKILLLTLSGLITCAPLILFAYGARRLPLGTLGFLGYLSPSLKFICGWLIFSEVLSPARMQAFVLIWIALLWYSAELILSHNKSLKKKGEVIVVTE
ncbi:MAG: EamA family transporter RarD [Bdellovibrionales bacterium]|nr:EamA family transporter RarD [Bdellovibrionales bacterium]